MRVYSPPSPRNIQSGHVRNWSAVCRLLPWIKVEKLAGLHRIHCILLKRNKKWPCWKTDVNTTWHLVKAQSLPIIRTILYVALFIFLFTSTVYEICTLFSSSFAVICWVYVWVNVSQDVGLNQRWIWINRLSLTRKSDNVQGKKKAKNAEQNTSCLFSNPSHLHVSSQNCTCPCYKFIPVLIPSGLCPGYTFLYFICSTNQQMHCKRQIL